MPLITVKMWPGRDEEKKKAAALAIMKAASEALGTREEAFTVILEEIPTEEWQEKVVTPDVEPRKHLVYIERGVLVKN